MAVIQNQAIIQKLIDELELYPALDKIPTELADKILPTFQVNSEEITVKTPTTNVVRTLSKSASASTSTIYTTPATGKFYLTNVSLQASLAIVNTDTECHIIATIDGVAQTIAQLMLSTNPTINTQVASSVVFNLQNPILLSPGTIISLTNASANINGSTATIIGYTEA